MLHQYQGWVDTDISWTLRWQFDQAAVVSRLALCAVWFGLETYSFLSSLQPNFSAHAEYLS